MRPAPDVYERYPRVRGACVITWLQSSQFADVSRSRYGGGYSDRWPFGQCAGVQHPR